MLMFGFVGFGQAGGFFANLAKTFQYPSLAINTAKIDLESLDHLTSDEKIHLTGYEGAGKDREIGYEAFESHKEMLVKRMEEKFMDAQVLFPVFSLGGGTGSGMVKAALDTLTDVFEHKVICPILFFPSQNESPRNKMNALEAFADFSQNENIGASFLFDNEKILLLQSSCSLKDKYANNHKDFLTLLHALNQKTAVSSEISTIDKMDLLTVLSERGASLICDALLEEEQLNSSSKLKEQLLSSWTYTAFCDCDMNSFSRVIVSLEAPVLLTNELVFEQTLQSIGTPLEIFSGVYDSKEEISSIQLLTGLSFPSKIVKEMETSIRKKEERLIQSAERNRSQQYELNNSWGSALKKKKKITIG